MDRLLLLLWYGNVVGEVLVFGRLRVSGLLSKYKWFAAYIAISALRDAFLVVASSAQVLSRSVWPMWAITEPIIIGLEVLMVVETYFLITEAYPGLDSFGMWVLAISTGLALLVSGAFSFVEWRGYSPYLFLVKRIVTAILLVFMLCVAWTFLFITNTLRPNLVRHSRILIVFLAGIAIGYFGSNIGLDRRFTNAFTLGSCFLCFIAWTFLLNRNGENLRPMLPVTPEERERNRRAKEQLLKIGRRFGKGR